MSDGTIIPFPLVGERLVKFRMPPSKKGEEQERPHPRTAFLERSQEFVRSNEAERIRREAEARAAASSPQELEDLLDQIEEELFCEEGIPDQNAYGFPDDCWLLTAGTLGSQWELHQYPICETSEAIQQWQRRVEEIIRSLSRMRFEPTANALRQRFDHHRHLLRQHNPTLFEASSPAPANLPEQASAGHRNRTNSDQKTGLSERQHNILMAMVKLGATSADTRQRTPAIAEKAEGFAVDSAGFKEPVKDLRSRDLILTKTGRGGGCWLTPNGLAMATTISENRQRAVASKRISAH